MKKTIALLLCGVFLFLCACEDTSKNEYVDYVNADDYTGIPRETQAEWFTEKPEEDSSNQNAEQTTVSNLATVDDLPEDFPAIPEGTSNVSITKHKAEESKYGHCSDWIRVEFSAPMQGIMQFSSDLQNAGYKGGIKHLKSDTGVYEYYGESWQGGWQNGKHLIRVVSWLAEIDGSYNLTLDIIECQKTFPPELEQYFPAFDGYSLYSAKYYEVLDNGQTKKHEFDGQFHEKWQMVYAYEGSFTGTTRQQFESYIKELEKQGFVGGTMSYRLDTCSAYIYDGANSEKSLYVSIIYNETLSTIEILYTNDGTDFL